MTPPQPTGAGAAAAGAPSGRRRVWYLIALLAGAGAMVGGALAWRSHARRQRVLAAVPATPDLKGRPAKFGELLAQASALARSPGRTVEGLAELGRLYHANGFRAQAEACWRALRAAQPREARWAYYLADLRRTASDYAETAALLTATTELAPDYAPAWWQLAEQEFKTGATEAAERHYRRRLALVPGDPYARLGLARVALQAGRRDEARQQIEGIVRDVPDFPTSHNLYAEMLAADGDDAGARRERQLGRNAGRFREADDPWLSELNAWCYDPKRLFVLGTIQYQIGQGDRGLAWFERAVALTPDEPPGYEMLGDIYLKLGEPAKARDTLERCLKLPAASHPPPMIFVMLSQTYRVLHQPEEALRAAERGLAKAGPAPELHNARGAALADLGRHEEAVSAYREAIRLNANDTEANFNLGASLLTLGQLDDAIEHLKRSLMLQPRFPQALALLGRIALDSGHLEEAAGYFRPLIETNPDLPQARQLMALWHLKAGMLAAERQDATAAERHYRDGLVLVPGEPELSASLGTLYLVQGRFADALEPIEAFHRARGDDPQSALFLGQVYAALGRTPEARRVLTEGAALADRLGKKATAAYCREILQQL